MSVWEAYYSALRQLPERLKRPVPFVVEALPTLRSRKARTVLDLGCCAGRHCVCLAKNGFDVVGVDISREALRIARAWARVEGVRDISFIRACMTNLPFIDHRFDAVISISVVHHAVKRDIVKTMGEIYRILRESGLFLANLLSVDDYRYGMGKKIEKRTFKVHEDFEEKRIKEIHHFFTKEEALDLLASFRKVSIAPLVGGEKNLHRYWKILAIK
jgi:ubiquinone/menaquinone biosynthesis C-methylase UbiE